MATNKRKAEAKRKKDKFAKDWYNTSYRDKIRLKERAARRSKPWHDLFYLPEDKHFNTAFANAPLVAKRKAELAAEQLALDMLDQQTKDYNRNWKWKDILNKQAFDKRRRLEYQKSYRAFWDRKRKEKAAKEWLEAHPLPKRINPRQRHKSKLQDWFAKHGIV